MTRTLYFGGPILTMDKGSPRAEALLTENGTILAVGSLPELEAAAPEAKRVDLGGKTLIPGFVDGHSHMINTGLLLAHKCDLTGCTSFDEILERIRDFREKRDLTHGEIIRARGYDLELLKEGTHPTAAVLDSLGFDNPISCTHQSDHMAVYNTAAMKKAGLLDREYVCPEGGYAGRDENGNLTGYFEEKARAPLARLYDNHFSTDEIESAIVAAQDYYIRHGYTTVQEGGGNLDPRPTCMMHVADAGKLKIDVVMYVSAAARQIPSREYMIGYCGGGYKNHLKFGGVKTFLDGSPQARTAWMLEPYEGESEYRGYPVATDETVRSIVRDTIDHRLQLMAHCNGSAAAEQFLKAWEQESSEKERGADLRPVMIHSQTVTYEQLDRMKAVGMMPSFFIGHCFYWGDTHIRNLGERGYRISPVKEALKRGMVFSLHQDTPVTEPNMLHSVWCAVNRVTRTGVCVGAENRIDCYDALIAATNGGAYTYHEEDTKGILKKGAIADFVILDRDPTAVPSMEIKDIRVMQTIKEDKVVYSESSAGSA